MRRWLTVIVVVMALSLMNAVSLILFRHFLFRRISTIWLISNNEYPSCTSASVLQELHALLSYGNCCLSYFFKVKEFLSDLSSRTFFMVTVLTESLEAWLHQPDTEPHRARSRKVQMTC